MLDPVPLTRGGLFLPFFGFLESSGFPIEPCLSDVMIPTDALSDPDALIPLNQGLRFLNRIAQAEHLDGWGLRVGSLARVAELGLLGKVITQAPNLSIAIDRLSWGASYCCATLKVWHSRWEEKSRLCFEFSGPASAYQHFNEFILMLLGAVVRLFAGPRWRPAEIHATDELFATLTAHCPVCLEAPISRQPIIALVFEPSLLNIRGEAKQFLRTQLIGS